MQTRGASRRGATSTALTLRDLALPSEGPPINNAGYLTGSVLETSGGFLASQPLLKFLAQHRSETVRFLIDQIALNQSVHNVEVDLPAQTVDDPYILNRGSVPYSVENARVTRRLTDWVYDPTNARVLMLVGQSEGHIADILVQYDVERDSLSDALHVCESLSKHIGSQDATATELLHTHISAPITQDRSARHDCQAQSDSNGIRV